MNNNVDDNVHKAKKWVSEGLYRFNDFIWSILYHGIDHILDMIFLNLKALL